mgnify:CR=1 FL=1
MMGGEGYGTGLLLVHSLKSKIECCFRALRDGHEGVGGDGGGVKEVGLGESMFMVLGKAGSWNRHGYSEVKVII